MSTFQLVRAIPGFRDMAVVNGQRGFTRFTCLPMLTHDLSKAIYCFKKALFLIHAINIRFGSISPPPFPIPTTSGIPVFTDNVLPSLLIHLGVIDLTASPALSSLFPNVEAEDRLDALLGPRLSANGEDGPVAKHPPREGPILTSDQAYILRAAAIDACELIVEVAHSLDPSTLSIGDGESVAWIRDISLPELDMWIWGVAKDRPDYRKLERFALRNTVFF